MNETIRVLKERRSIRKYKSQQIKEEELSAILEAGTYAATGMGGQSPVMVVLQDEKTIKKFSQWNGEIMGSKEIDPFYGAPTVIAVLANSEKVTYKEDGSLVMGNLMNAAYSLGVDSCWIHRAKETFQGEAKVYLEKWGLDSKYIGIGFCILGYRDVELTKPAKRKENYIIWDR